MLRPAADQGGWAIIAVAIGAGIAGAVQIGKVPAALPLIRAEYHLDLAAGAWILSCFTLIGIVLGAAAGALAGRFGTKPTLGGGLLMMGAASALGGIAPGYPLVLACRLAEGVGFTMVVSAAPTLIGAVASARQQKLAFGLWGTFMATGQTLMLLLSPWALRLVGWHGVWLINGLLLAAYGGAVLAGHFEAERTHRAGPGLSLVGLWRDTRRVATDRGPVLLALAFACYTTQYIVIVGFLPTLLTERDGVGAVAAALLTAPIGLFNIAGNVGGGLLLQRGVAIWKLSLISVCFMAACGCCVFAVSLPPPLTVILCLAFALIGGMLPAAIYSAVPQRAPAPSLVGATNGLVVQGSNLGQTLGPSLTGVIATAAGWSWASLVFVGAGIAGGALTLSLRRQSRAGA